MTTLIPKFEQTNSTTNRAFNLKLQESISVLDFGADPTGATDSSTAIQAAVDSGKAVYIPAGTYKCNVNINNKTIIYGDGSHISIVKANDTALPIMLYKASTTSTPSPAIYWSYHSEIRNLGFQGTSQVGIGFAFGSADPAVYVAGAEYANNVCFHNCLFQGLNKGVMFPFGNIGSQFYACGFQQNYYGVYSKSNNSGSGDIMHAGNKYFYGGEFSGNTCGAYFDNAIDGFGGVAFTDTIFEANINAVYINNQVDYGLYFPPMFKDCWNEANGERCPTAGNAVVDTWIGGVQGSVNLGRYPFFFNERQITIDGGYVSGIALGSAFSTVHVKNARVEWLYGLGGQDFSVSSVNSAIEFENCYTGGGFSENNPQCFAIGINHVLYPNVTDYYYAAGRARIFPVSYSKSSSTSLSGVVEPFTSAVAYTGSFSGNGTVIADGTKFATCNNFIIPFTTTSQYIQFNSTNLSAIGSSWYVVTLDIQVASGTVAVFVDDNSTNKLIRQDATATSRWVTVAGLGYYPNTASSVLRIGSVTGGTCNFNLGAFQMYRFFSQAQAEAFIAQNNFVS